MNLVRIRVRIGEGFVNIEEGTGRSFDDMVHLFNPFLAYRERSWRPRIDIYEDRDAFIILVELAGVEAADIDLEINSRSLRLTGRRNRRALPQEARYHLAEIPYGSFERAFSLTADIDTETVTASYLEGLLEIRMTKLSTIRKTRKIAVVTC
ncbi:MAG: Hsp20/alpha crystallin family protein [Smithellaceae bacterium]|nr:Hsp20/alpha crystallin family protein [Smithellaceae bacterium]